MRAKTFGVVFVRVLLACTVCLHLPHVLLFSVNVKARFPQAPSPLRTGREVRLGVMPQTA